MSVKHLTTGAVAGALYAVLSLFSSVFGVAYGPIQCRFSEALCVLPFFFPETVWGLGVGCLVANILSPYGALDMIFGTLATLLAALWTSRCRCRWLAPLPPVICNMVLVGFVLTIQQTGFTAAFWPALLLNSSSVALGELIAGYALGLCLIRVIEKNPAFRGKRGNKERRSR